MNLAQEDVVISDFLRSLGPWNQVVTIGGGYAMIIYRLYLADRNVGNIPIGTKDIDSLIPRRVPSSSEKSIASLLKDAGFLHIYKDLYNPPTECYLKEINGKEIEVEFITDKSARVNKCEPICVSGVVAQPLSYLELSLQTRREFQTFSRAKGYVVSPGAWVFHKGLTFIKRDNSDKFFKDLYGIWFTLTQLGNFSAEAKLELNSLGLKWSSWMRMFKKNLLKWVKRADSQAWVKLQRQDPRGGLKRTDFERLVMELSA